MPSTAHPNRSDMHIYGDEDTGQPPGTVVPAPLTEIKLNATLRNYARLPSSSERALTRWIGWARVSITSTCPTGKSSSQRRRTSSWSADSMSLLR